MFIMVALCNRADHYIFVSVGLLSWKILHNDVSSYYDDIVKKHEVKMPESFKILIKTWLRD